MGLVDSFDCRTAPVYHPPFAHFAGYRIACVASLYRLLPGGISSSVAAYL